VDRSFSKQSSISGDDLNDIDDDDDEASADDSKKKKKKYCHTPFIFRMLKLNGPEWRWILLGAIGSLTYGAIQPLFALFFTQIYGLFAEPDLNEQKRLTSIYAGGIFLVGFIGGVAQFLSTVGFSKSGEELTLRMRKLTFAAILRQEMGYFDHETNAVGALVTRLSSDASALKVRLHEINSLVDIR
jgi:ABC-type multidrug transport system fused ATPase/permease subunit